jgi:hypothetical protein
MSRILMVTRQGTARRPDANRRAALRQVFAQMAQVFGTRRQILADVLEQFVPGFRRTDFVEVINRTPGRSSGSCLTGLTTRQ